MAKLVKSQELKHTPSAFDLPHRLRLTTSDLPIERLGAIDLPLHPGFDMRGAVETGVDDMAISYILGETLTRHFVVSGSHRFHGESLLIAQLGIQAKRVGDGPQLFLDAAHRFDLSWAQAIDRELGDTKVSLRYPCPMTLPSDRQLIRTNKAPDLCLGSSAMGLRERARFRRPQFSIRLDDEEPCIARHSGNMQYASEVYADLSTALTLKQTSSCCPLLGNLLRQLGNAEEPVVQTLQHLLD